MTLCFSVNGQAQRVDAISPTMTVLDYIRDKMQLTGTKEGCAEGDCGACTIVLAQNSAEGTSYHAANSCIMMLPQIAGTNVITVEGLCKKGNSNDESLDLIQTVMIETGGTQCGFCTPGIIMSLFALRNSGEQITDNLIHDALAGNLCRCTGYRPIIEAAKKASVAPPNQETFGSFSVVSRYNADDQVFFFPKNLEELAMLCARYPDARILNGGTDLGLLVSKDREKLGKIIYLRQVDELALISETKTKINIGAAVTYTEAYPIIKQCFPSFAKLITRIGSFQIRNIGTIGGNIATASPIGDTLPCLMVLDASLVLCSLEGERELPIEEFFIDYRKTALKKGEFIKQINIPKLQNSEDFRTYKVSKRFDQDISAVIGAYVVDRRAGRMKTIRVAYGGMADKPKRALACENFLQGKRWDLEALRSVSEFVHSDFQPISDFRASKNYRMKVASNLFERLFWDLENPSEPNELVSL